MKLARLLLAVADIVRTRSVCASGGTFSDWVAILICSNNVAVLVCANHVAIFVCPNRVAIFISANHVAVLVCANHVAVLVNLGCAVLVLEMCHFQGNEGKNNTKSTY